MKDTQTTSNELKSHYNHFYAVSQLIRRKSVFRRLKNRIPKYSCSSIINVQTVFTAHAITIPTYVSFNSALLYNILSQSKTS